MIFIGLYFKQILESLARYACLYYYLYIYIYFRRYADFRVMPTRPWILICRRSVTITNSLKKLNETEHTICQCVHEWDTIPLSTNEYL